MNLDNDTNEYQRKYFQSNRFKSFADNIKREADEANRKRSERKKYRKREYRENNREKILIYSKEYYHNNKERLSAYSKEYARKNVSGLSDRYIKEIIISGTNLKLSDITDRQLIELYRLNLQLKRELKCKQRNQSTI